MFYSLKNRYQNDLEQVNCSQFVSDYVQLLCYKCNKINSNCGGSYIDSPDWEKTKKATRNPINMLSAGCNSRFKLQRNQKRSAKNDKN